MNKKFVIKTLTLVNMIFIGVIAIMGFIIAIANDEVMIRAFGLGLGIGALVGGTIKCLVFIPKKYADKDERTMLVVLLSHLISQSVFGLSAYLFLMVALTGIVAVGTFNIPIILAIVGIIVALTFIAEKVSYAIINNKM